MRYGDKVQRRDGSEVYAIMGRKIIERQEGKAEGKAEDIIELLLELGTVSECLRETIMSQMDLQILKDWLKLAAKSKSVEAFQRAAGL